ncbi:MAG TPA: M13 family metallopeptidase N-terminal domain-containing protein, partial [Thermoanaerobaculia bacterium]|nr:M13 family metallopeptidase N-terminal domain-containing protein [Thermoanaerobaculia bacterium]
MIRNLAVAVLIALSQLQAGAPAATEARRSQKGIETADLDRTVDPCADFYEFANGAWRKANPIPESTPRWSRRVAAHEANARRVEEILAEVSRRTDWPKGSVERLIGDHYASCMDETAIEAAGLAPLAPLLGEIDGIRNPADVQRVIRRLHDLAVPVPFGVAGALDYEEPSRYVGSVVAGTLGMGDRDPYVKTEPRFAEMRGKYRRHVARVLALGGMPESAAGPAADAVVELESRLAE